MFYYFIRHFKHRRLVNAQSTECLAVMNIALRSDSKQCLFVSPPSGSRTGKCVNVEPCTSGALLSVASGQAELVLGGPDVVVAKK